MFMQLAVTYLLLSLPERTGRRTTGSSFTRSLLSFPIPDMDTQDAPRFTSLGSIQRSREIGGRKHETFKPIISIDFMEKKQVGGWRQAPELTDCRQDTEVALVFDNREHYQGIFRGFDGDDEEIVLQATGSESKIGLPFGRLYAWCVVEEVKPIAATVYPSNEQTISVVEDATYGGAHCYIIRECLGFVDGATKYADTEQVVQFVQTSDDGSTIPGLQSEQLVLALLDRHRKLNAHFPSEQNAQMIAGLHMFLDACGERVKDRVERGVMGKLKK